MSAILGDMGHLILSTALVLAAQSADTHFEDDLRVLFVGQDPAAPQIGYADAEKARTLPLLRERTGAWEALLRYHFKNVTVVYGADYEASMSDAVDVTIFDALPKPLVEAVREQDPDTGEWSYEPPVYLPDDFSRPALAIAHHTPRIGEALGTKLDWL